MQLYKRKGSPNWWATWYDPNGKRNRRSSGTADRKLAETLISKWVQEDFMEQHFGKIPETPFNDALLNYAKAQKRDHPKHFNTITRYQLQMLQSWFGQFMLPEITSVVIRRYFDERRESVKETTAQKNVSTLRAILHRAVDDGLLGTVPSFPKMKAPKPRSRFLTPEEEERLIRCSASHLVPLIRFAVETGGRSSEILNLSWDTVDLEKGLITFKDTKNGDDRTIRLTVAPRLFW
jgi:integrase